MDELYKQIGKQKIEIEWLKKRWGYLSRVNNLTPNQIAETHLDKLESKLTLKRQCELLGISRSSAYYYEPIQVSLNGSFLYLVVFIDWFARYILSWRLSNSLRTDFCLEAANAALTINIPNIVNFDQGVQFTDEQMIAVWANRETKISMDHKGRCFDNIFVERFWRTLKYEEVYLKDYTSPFEARESIAKYIDKYNFQRPHSSLGYKTPAEIYFAN